MFFEKFARGKYFLLSAILTGTLSLNPCYSQSENQEQQLQKIYNAQIPKDETGVSEFLKQHPEYDGRDVVIAIFDTGVDPEAPGMQLTSTGERKLVDVYDASGAGDVDTSTTATPDKDGTLAGLTGRTLILPEAMQNPSGTFRIGIKHGKELFHEDVWDRLMKYRSHQTQLLATQSKADLMRTKSEQNPPEKGSRAEQQLDALDEVFKNYLEGVQSLDKGPFYDCVLWQDAASHWNVVVDTDEDGDLRDEKILQPFGINGDWASFPDYVSMNFAVQVFEDGKKLSIVTTSGSHGTHVASIAAAHYPENPAFDGIAPGAKILSIRIGDIRSGGSSTYWGESSAVALAAQHDVDIMNASWGGQSYYQNADNWGVKLYNMLVEKYGVTAFVSAGNDGPALSTMGSPGGEARNVIGVGAYVSPEMGEYLYSVVEDTPATTFMFTARGPARNGDMGVDILAPGAAVTNLAKDSLRNSELYNGTSMASPSAAGVGALLISAAKQNGLHTSPARIRYALMNSAYYFENEDPFSQGAGLIDVNAAWEHLKQFQSIPALDLFYDVEVSNNTYSDGPGLYLRGDESALKGTESVTIQIEPVFPEEFSNRSQYDLNLYLQGEQPASWLTTPEVVHMANSDSIIRPKLDLDAIAIDRAETGEQVHFASWNLHLAEHPEAGPIVRIPFTIVAGESAPAKRWLDSEAFTLNSSTSFRKFITPHARATQLTVKIRREADDQVENLYVFHALSLLPNAEIDGYETRRYFRLKSGEEATFEVPVLGGEAMELNVHQVWSYANPSTLTLSGTWHGLETSSPSAIIFEQPRPDYINVRSMFETSLNIEAQLDEEVYSFAANKSTILPFDRRGSFPKGKKDVVENTSFVLTQEFKLECSESVKVLFDQSQYTTEFSAGGGIIEIYDTQGFIEATALAPMDPDEAISLSKGNKTVIRQFISNDLAVLERLKELPLLARVKMDALDFKIYQGLKNFSSDSATTTLNLDANKASAVFLKPNEMPKTAKLEIIPDYVEGALTYKEDEKRVGITTVRLFQKPQPSNETSDTPSTGDADTSSAFNEAIYETKLEFLKNTRWQQNSENQKAREQLFRELLKNTTDPRLWLEEIYDLAIEDHLLHSWMNTDTENAIDSVTEATSDGKEVKRKITNMIKNCYPDKVSQYLGAKPFNDLPDSPEAKKQKAQRENYEKISQYLSDVYLLTADIHLKLGETTEAREFFNESKRWNRGAPDSDLQARFEIQLLLNEGFPILAAGRVQEVLKENPDNLLLKSWRQKIYEKLGWTLGSKLETLYQNVSQNAGKLR